MPFLKWLKQLLRYAVCVCVCVRVRECMWTITGERPHCSISFLNIRTTHLPSHPPAFFGGRAGNDYGGCKVGQTVQSCYVSANTAFCTWHVNARTIQRYSRLYACFAKINCNLPLKNIQTRTEHTDVCCFCVYLFSAYESFKHGSYLSYIRTQFVPLCKHSPLQL